MNTDLTAAKRALGMPACECRDIKPDHAGQQCDTWILVLAKNVKGWGRRGSVHRFPVPHKGVTNG